MKIDKFFEMRMNRAKNLKFYVESLKKKGVIECGLYSEKWDSV